MKCQQVDVNIEHFLDSQLPILQHDAISAHIKTCGTCYTKLTKEKDLRHALKNLPVEDVNPDFLKEAMQKAHHNHKPEQKYFISGFTSAIAASLVVWFLSSNTIATAPENNQFPLISMALNKTRTVQMIFDSPGDFKAVKFNLKLPEGFEIAGYPGQKELDWRVDIKKGSNILTLPLIALTVGKGDLVARIAHINKSKSFRLHIRSKEENNLIL